MGKISVVINTLNEEKNLPKAIASVKGLADEVVVVDAKSTDRTVEIAKKAGAKVHIYKKPVRYVEPVRNYAISKAIGDWILILDADEEISSSLSSRLRKIVKNPDADYYRLPRKNIIFGKWLKHSRWWPDYNIRFFKKGKVIWSEIIHSVPETHGKGLDLEAISEYAIIHYHYTSLEQYVERMNRYTTEHAKLRIKDGYKFSWQDLIKKPSSEFLSRYFQGEGYKDGIHGLALASLQSFSELVLHLKIWQAGRFKKQDVHIKEVVEAMRESEADYHYWQADSLLKFGGGLLQRIKRKFKLS
jgi:(heptosyl)LPS beta-1,4-glucosyltransferase